jgi:hypothetical protein
MKAADRGELFLRDSHLFAGATDRAPKLRAPAVRS